MIQCAKIISLSMMMFPIAFCGLSVGILFGCYIMGASKNPEESENLYNAAMTSFVLVETFAFLSVLIGCFIAFAL